ncbi:isoprenyl transferase [Paenibacillus sp. Z6-24]
MFKRVRSWWGKEEQQSSGELSQENIPQHIAIIMDGNGRWAKSLGMPRVIGHQNGMKAVKRATIAADELGVKYLTMYAFSTENWKRPREEVDFLMKLPGEFVATELEELVEKNVQVRLMGDKSVLPSFTLEPLEKAIRDTQHNTGLVLTFAMNYGSRVEITEGVKKMVQAVQNGVMSVEDINPDTFGTVLQSSDLPDPDLLIRTSGELRLSNFMLWQLAYSELWFTPIYWPEFGKEHMIEAVAEYQRRIRRYGGL